MTPDAVNLLSQQVDAAVAEYLSALERGESPNRAAFLAEHAEVAAELEQFLADYQALEQVVPRPAVGVSTDGVAASTGRTTQAERPPLMSPRRIGNFELLAEIARGGMGVVYKARQITPSRVVALKMILSGQLASKADVDRFYAEAQAAATLDHPQIVPIFEVGEHEGQHYFTMAYVEGESLAQRLARGPIAAHEAAKIIRDVALAVEYAHQRGVIHRDLKPANILCDVDGRVRVTDFGLAKRQTDETGLTNTGQLLGTPSFMSPEQVCGDLGQVGVASDVYSLGATIYALVTGRPPFQAASTIDTLRQVLEKDPVPLRELDATIPRDLETITLKCLDKEPAGRYQSAHKLANELQYFLAGKPILARRVSRIERTWRWCRRHPQVAALATSVAMLLVAVAVLSTVGYARAKRQQLAAQQSAARETELRTAAEQNFRQAKKTVDDYLTLVSQTKLLEVPGLQPLRKELLERALQYYQDFAETHADDPGVASGLAEAYFRVGTIKRIVGDDAEAIDALQAACRIWETCRDNEQFSPDLSANLATTYANLAILQNEQGNTGAALELYRNSQTAWEKLTAQHPQDLDYRLSLARTLDQIALMLGKDNLSEASRLQVEAYEHFQAILDAVPDDLNNRRYLAGHLVNVAILQSEAGDTQGAVQSLVRARNILEQRLDLGNQDLQFQRQLAEVHSRIGQLQSTAGDQIHALTSFASAGQIQATLVAGNPTVPDLKRDYVKTLTDLAAAQLQDGDLADAISSHSAACKLIDELIQQAPPSQTAWLSQSAIVEEFAGRLRDNGHYPEAATQYQELWKQICGHRGNQHRSAAVALSHLALCQAAADDGPGYRASCEMLLTTFAETADPVVANDVAWTCSLRPDGSENWGIILRLAKFACSSASENHEYQYALGAALFRNERFEEARPVFLARINSSQSDCDASDGLFLAMVYHRLGHFKEARQWLTDSTDMVPTERPFRITNADDGRDPSPLDYIECRLLQSEAQKVLDEVSPDSAKD